MPVTEVNLHMVSRQGTYYELLVKTNKLSNVVLSNRFCWQTNPEKTTNLPVFVDLIAQTF